MRHFQSFMQKRQVLRHPPAHPCVNPLHSSTKIASEVKCPSFEVSGALMQFRSLQDTKEFGHINPFLGLM